VETDFQTGSLFNNVTMLFAMQWNADHLWSLVSLLIIRVESPDLMVHSQFIRNDSALLTR